MTMRFNKRTLSMAALLELQASHSTDRVVFAQQPPTGAAAGSPRARAAQQLGLRVQQRTYHLGDTNVDLSYAVFVSTTVTKDRKRPGSTVYFMFTSKNASDSGVISSDYGLRFTPLQVYSLKSLGLLDRAGRGAVHARFGLARARRNASRWR